VRSGAILAALRSTTIGAAIEESATAPFTRGRWLLSHNGAVPPKQARALLPPGAPEPESTCDSAVLAAVVFARVEAGEPAPEVLADVVTRLGAADPAARLNLLLTDGAAVVATRWGASLSYLADRGLAAGGALIASEPLDDDPGWIDVPDFALLIATPEAVTCTALEVSP
jgi:glutamine amidotransferase